MKKLLSALLIAALLGLPSLAMAKGKKGPKVHGKVTAVTANSITIQEGKKADAKTETITVPEGTPITTKDGSPAPALSELVGKRVKIKETADGAAKSIVVTAKKGKKKDA
jgi:hypothetical protein